MNDYEMEKMWEEFFTLMTRTGVFARLCEATGPYIGRMSNADRETMLEHALGMAWTGIEHFNPNRRSLMSYWDDCLQSALNSRLVWRLRWRDVWHVVASSDVLVLAEEES